VFGGKKEGKSNFLKTEAVLPLTIEERSGGTSPGSADGTTWEDCGLKVGFRCRKKGELGGISS